MSRKVNVPVVCDLLRGGPKTNAEIAEHLGWFSYEVASLMSKMRNNGYVTRTLGRGRRATYYLAAQL